MILLHRIFSLLLLFALAEIDTSYSLDSDVHVISSSSDRKVRDRTELYPGGTIKTGGYALTLLAMFECARLTLLPDTQARSDTRRYHSAGQAGQNRILLSLVKRALRSVTGYIGGGARTGYQIPTRTMLIGIRG